jgi:hypothetical protein
MKKIQANADIIKVKMLALNSKTFFFDEKSL